MANAECLAHAYSWKNIKKALKVVISGRRRWGKKDLLILIVLFSALLELLKYIYVFLKKKILIFGGVLKVWVIFKISR